ncbi:MAG: glycosyltransferase family 9 protein [bacterium]|nr:glycosyltransferase family 9 protein [bacterium]
MKLSRPFPDFHPRKILLLQLRRIGDAVLCTPAIRAVAKQFPGAQLDFVAEYPAEETLRSHPQIHRLWVAPYRGFWDMVELLRGLRRERYDLVVDFFSNPRSAQFTFATGAKVRCGLGRRGRAWAYTHHFIEEQSDEDLYAVDIRLRQLELLGIPGDGRKLEIFSDQADDQARKRAEHVVDALTGIIVAVAAGSSNPSKRYPPDLTAQAIDLLRASHMQVVLTSGPGEEEYARRVLEKVHYTVPHFDNAHVPDLTALYRHCALYVGPDSGTKHVAAACGLPTVTIFGPGRPSNWNVPDDPRNVLLAAPCKFRPNCDELTCAKLGHIAQISPREILAAALKLLLE